MRPRKKILLYCQDEFRMSALRMAIDLRGYKVFSSRTVDEATAVLAVHQISTTVIVRASAHDASLVAADTLFQYLDSPVVFFDDCNRPLEKLFSDHISASIYIPRAAGHASFLDHIRVFTARKRGPKKTPTINKEVA